MHVAHVDLRRFGKRRRAFDDSRGNHERGESNFESLGHGRTPCSSATLQLVSFRILREQRCRAIILQNCRTPDAGMTLDTAAMLDWNDLRYFIAVAREGSTLAAGRALRTSQTTVARRIAALERVLGYPLFEKRQAGYVITPAGETLLRHAEKVGASADSFSEAATAYARELSGTVRITSEDIYMNGLLSPLLRDLHELHPEIMIELDAGQEMRDLGAGEADNALRSSSRDQPAGLVGRTLCRDDWT